MTLKLKEIATVLSGVAFRARVRPSNRGSVKLIQMKDLGDDNFVRLDKVMRIEREAFHPNQFVRRGDIIFRSRGQGHTACLLQEDAENTVVAAPLFHVRPNIKKVMPEFLFWWINQSTSQSYLVSLSEGSKLKMIRKQVLEDLEVKLPSLAEQRKIVEFFRLLIREQKLLEEIKNHKAVYVERVLLDRVSKFCEEASYKKSMLPKLLEEHKFHFGTCGKA